MQLPDHQPARAVTVTAYYVGAVAVGTGLLQLRFSGAVGFALAVMWAMALLVPLAVLAPRRAPEEAAAQDSRPILQRSKPSPKPMRSVGTPPPASPPTTPSSKPGSGT